MDVLRGARSSRIGLSAMLGLAGVAGFTVAVASLHLRSGRVRWYLSEFAAGPDAWLWLTALGLLGGGGACLAYALWLWLPPSTCRDRTLAFLIAAALALSLVAALPADPQPTRPTVIGIAHNTAAASLFLLVAGGMLSAAPAFSLFANWRALAWACRLGGWSVLACSAGVLAAQANSDAVVMLAQRAVVAAILCWMVIVGLALLRRPAPSRLERGAAKRLLADAASTPE